MTNLIEQLIAFLRQHEIINMDGIVNMRNPVVTMEDYRYLKKLISEIDGVVICSPDNVTICSLTVLQEDKR